MISLSDTAKKLSELSTKNYLNPYTYIDWAAEMPREQWFMSPELISIYGTETFEKLTEKEQQLLSFFEAVNFFSLNIHGEKPLVEGLAKRLYSKELKEFAVYLHHFLDEENKHMIYFGGFCQRYAGKIYRDRKLVIPREYEPGEDDFLFFAKVMIFEELVDMYNIKMSSDERLEPISRKINQVHHAEEARHLVFGRHMVEHLFQKYSSSWSPSTLIAMQDYLKNYVVATWKEYYNPDVYKDALLASPYELLEQAWNCSVQREHRKKISSRLLDYLKQRNMIVEYPEL